MLFPLSCDFFRLQTSLFACLLFSSRRPALFPHANPVEIRRNTFASKQPSFFSNLGRKDVF